MAEKDLYEQLDRGGRRDLRRRTAGTRALHAKGAWCEGTFTATPEAAALSQPRFHLAGEPVAALVRFSNAPRRSRGRTTASARPRGFAVKLRGGDGEEADILATTTPAFVDPYPGGLPRAARAAPARPGDRPARLREARRFLGRPPRGADRDPGHDRGRAAGELRHRPSTTRRTPSASSTPRASARRSGCAGSPTRASSGFDDDEAKARGRDYLYEDLERAARGRRRDRLRAALPARGATTTRSTMRPRSGPTSASWSPRAGSRSPRASTTPSATATSTSSTRCGSPTASSLRATRSCTRVAEAYSVSAYRRWGRERGPAPS